MTGTLVAMRIRWNEGRGDLLVVVVEAIWPIHVFHRGDWRPSAASYNNSPPGRHVANQPGWRVATPRRNRRVGPARMVGTVATDHFYFTLVDAARRDLMARPVRDRRAATPF